MSNLGPAPASWAWNFRWTIPDVERALVMARRGEHVSTIARVFATTVEEVRAMLRRNLPDFAGGGDDPRLGG